MTNRFGGEIYSLSRCLGSNCSPLCWKPSAGMQTTDWVEPKPPKQADELVFCSIRWAANTSKRSHQHAGADRILFFSSLTHSRDFVEHVDVCDVYCRLLCLAWEALEPASPIGLMCLIWVQMKKKTIQAAPRPSMIGKGCVYASELQVSVDQSRSVCQQAFIHRGRWVVTWTNPEPSRAAALHPWSV